MTAYEICSARTRRVLVWSNRMRGYGIKFAGCHLVRPSPDALRGMLDYRNQGLSQ
ncbi:hypothetical protein K438DRAFT_1839164 [Mycena galopus ATCC 62051]|nr:hypothetical protein K438DRAFT_1839164 [Mycena galopus ATCC 62051]